MARKGIKVGKNLFTTSSTITNIEHQNNSASPLLSNCLNDMETAVAQMRKRGILKVEEDPLDLSTAPTFTTFEGRVKGNSSLRKPEDTIGEADDEDR